MSLSHPKCKPNEHVCHQPSGRTCIEAGCNEPAGTLWGPLWCPNHDFVRLERISASFDALAAGQAPDPMLIASHAPDCDLIVKRPFAMMRGHVCTCGAGQAPAAPGEVT